MKYRTDMIDKILKRYPNAQISITPTPIYRLSRLSSFLNCNIYIMREDLTGFGIGGNKIRKLDYLIGDALAKEADTLLTTKATSFSRNAAVAGKVFGFEVHILIVGDKSKQNSASLELYELYNATLHYAPEEGGEDVTLQYNEILDNLIRQGKRIYELHPGGSDSIGALGYVNAFNQLVKYSNDTGIHFHKIIQSTGSTATQVGLLIGQGISGYDTTILGMSSGREAVDQKSKIGELAASTAAMLGVQFDEKKIVVEDRFVGPGYFIPSDEGNEAMKIMANMEGVVLDPVYTAKAAAGLLYYAMNGMFCKEENILFIHTGGNGGLYY